MDDNKSTHRSLTIIFERKGFKIEAVRTGREAVEKTQENFFNINLIDIRLPDISESNFI